MFFGKKSIKLNFSFEICKIIKNLFKNSIFKFLFDFEIEIPEIFFILLIIKFIISIFSFSLILLL